MPLVAIDVPVRGLPSTERAGTWFEAVFEQRRRLAALDGTPPGEINREILRQARLWYPLLVEKRTPRDILEKDSALRKLGWITNEVYVGERHYKFHHQLADKNLADAWISACMPRQTNNGQRSSPRVLAIWGASDWLVDRDSNAWIAEVVNRMKPGAGTFVTIEGIDHFFLRAATQQESYRLWKPEKNSPTRELNPAILKTLRAWFEELVAHR